MHAKENPKLLLLTAFPFFRGRHSESLFSILKENPKQQPKNGLKKAKFRGTRTNRNVLAFKAVCFFASGMKIGLGSTLLRLGFLPSEADAPASIENVLLPAFQNERFQKRARCRPRWDSNPQSPAPEADALSIRPLGHCVTKRISGF